MRLPKFADKHHFRHIDTLDLKLCFVRAVSGENVPLRGGQRLKSDLTTTLVDGNIPDGIEAIGFVGKDRTLNTILIPTPKTVYKTASRFWTSDVLNTSSMFNRIFTAPFTLAMPRR